MLVIFYYNFKQITEYAKKPRHPIMFAKYIFDVRGDNLSMTNCLCMCCLEICNFLHFCNQMIFMIGLL